MPDDVRQPDDLIDRIAAAFAERSLPDGTAITRCAYDRLNGGTMDGPCWECADTQEFFAGKAWRDVSGSDLRRHGDVDALFTVPAYCYLLPAYLMAAVREPEQLDNCIDHLAYRFGPTEADDERTQRLRQVLQELTGRERAAARDYFQFALRREQDVGGYVGRAVRNLDAASA